SDSRCLDPNDPLPFEELLVPFATVANERLAARDGTGYANLAEPAWIDLERQLLRHLAELCGEALLLEFAIFRSARQSSLERLLASDAPPSRTQYRAFTRKMLGGGLPAFFQEYSVLARLVGTMLDNRIAATAELLERLASDRELIRQTFASAEPEGDFGPVIAIQLALSDPHDGGRTVSAVTFANRLRVAYKPRDVRPEAHFFALVEWCNRQGLSLPLKTLRVLDRGSYGWIEWAPYAPVEGPAAARCFYRRAGMLLRLVSVLEGTDCHAENLVACGEQPVVVDLETLPAPRLRESGDGLPQQLGGRRSDAVLRTDLLPCWYATEYGEWSDISALGGIDGRWTVATEWQKVNTDGMTRGHAGRLESPGANVPRLGDVPLAASEYAREVVDGFGEMQRLLVDCRDVLLQAGSPLPALTEQPVRFVLRDTRACDVLLRQARRPNTLRNGAAHSIQLEALAPALLAEERRHFWPLLRFEQEALEQGDIPRFSACASSDTLLLMDGQRIDRCFLAPSGAMVRARLAGLDDWELVEASGLIQAALEALGREGVVGVGETLPNHGDADSVVLDEEELLQAAVAVGDARRRRVIRYPDGSAGWAELRYSADHGRFQYQPVGYDLYGGRGGIALFLAALARVTGDAAWRDLALATLRPFCQLLQPFGPRHRLLAAMEVGGAEGAGSIVYALTHCGRLLDEPALVEQALAIAATLMPERIAVGGY
ncbi:MAG TPA: type 2 lanthipeptide synthetase LanM, partial [Ardenticatenaceae bacterium]|nr:type 2 lanthipeptide synthetase LanM [Ardenticatenaceae bacterium]